MPLIVETGAIVPNANSLIGRADVITYAALSGVALTDSEQTDQLAVQAMRYICAQEPLLMGQRVSREQAVCYPRKGVVVDGWSWGETEIPREAVLLQANLILDLVAGVDIYNPQPVRVAKRQKVDGAVEVEYFGPANMRLSRNSASVALLNSLKKRQGLFSVRMVRT